MGDGACRTCSQLHLGDPNTSAKLHGIQLIPFARTASFHATSTARTEPTPISTSIPPQSSATDESSTATSGQSPATPPDPTEEHAGDLPSAQIPVPSDGTPKFRAGVNGVTYPSCVYCPDPHYSEEARQAKLQGTVDLSVVVTPDGHAGRIAITKRLGDGLDENAEEAWRQWRFNPALGPDHNPVEVEVPITVTFRLLNSSSDGQAVAPSAQTESASAHQSPGTATSSQQQAPLVPASPRAADSVGVISKTEQNTEQQRVSRLGEERISPADFAALVQEAERTRADSQFTPALQNDGKVLSRSLLAYQKAYSGNSDYASRPQLQAISGLQDRLGKSIQPQRDDDLIEMNEVFRRCVRVARLGQTHDERGNLLGAGRNSAEFQQLLLSESATDVSNKVQKDVEVERAQRLVMGRIMTPMKACELALDRGDYQAALLAQQQIRAIPDEQTIPFLATYLRTTTATFNDLEAFSTR